MLSADRGVLDISFRLYIHFRPPVHLSQGLFCANNTLVAFMGQFYHSFPHPQWNYQAVSTSDHKVIHHSKFISDQVISSDILVT